MKLMIEHDDSGHIYRVAVPAADAKYKTALRPTPGRRVTEVEAEQLHDISQVRLADLRDGFRIDQARLVKR